MKTAETLEVSSKYEFREWLTEHFKTKKEIWLVYYYKHTGKQSVSYDESVEEAICFGWIDGQQNRMDEERFVRRFSPRRKNSHWSKYNKNRALRMLHAGKMTDWGLELLPSDVRAKWENETGGCRAA